MIEDQLSLLASTPKVKRITDLTGKVFGRLTALRRCGKTKSGNSIWECRCQCGVIKAVAGGDLRKGSTQSCGCYAREYWRERWTTHGMKQTREYRIWNGLKNRCCNKNDKDFPRYGGRGITVCRRWLHSFEAFFEDMGKCPPSQQIDRIDNDNGYEPSNCRWATPQQQSNNKRNNHRLTINGKTQNIVQWAMDFGIRADTLRFRIKLKWPVERLSEPVIQTITANGQTKTVEEWAQSLGLTPGAIYTRLSKGWNPERAVMPRMRESRR